MNEDLIRRVTQLESEIERLRTLETGDRSGSSFPSNPSAGDPPWFRTDRGLWYYYDGTRWLTTNEYSTPISFFRGNETESYSASTNSVRLNLVTSAALLYFTRLEFRPIITSPNDINDYWDVDFVYNGIFETISTQGLSTGATVFTRSEADFTQPVGTNQFISINLTKFNSAGNFFPRSAAVYYRLTG